MVAHVAAPKVLSWADPLTTEPEAIQQCARIARLDFVTPHIAVMPDVHVGKGACVGTAIPTVEALIPAAVGVDIGCGMMAVRTDFVRTDFAGRDLSALRLDIERSIPTVGRMPVYNATILDSAAERIAELETLATRLEVRPDTYDGKWHYQVGSLGGGNHFIELVTDETERVWLFLHSGSRGVGNKMAMAHIKSAVSYCAQAGIALEDRDLAYLGESETEFWDYLHCVEWAQRFALLNREEMMARLVDAVVRCVHPRDSWDEARATIRQETIACHHNYTERVGDAGWLTRKGAIDASSGVMGLVPGSMGTASYVVRGKGLAEALNSAPHGAGRRFSRRKARESFTMAEFVAQTVGVEMRRDESLLDEIPSAYKDIDEVIALAEPLVEVVHTFRQFLNVKGD